MVCVCTAPPLDLSLLLLHLTQFPSTCPQSHACHFGPTAFPSHHAFAREHPVASFFHPRSSRSDQARSRPSFFSIIPFSSWCGFVAAIACGFPSYDFALLFLRLMASPASPPLSFHTASNDPHVMFSDIVLLLVTYRHPLQHTPHEPPLSPPCYVHGCHYCIWPD